MSYVKPLLIAYQQPQHTLDVKYKSTAGGPGQQRRSNKFMCAALGHVIILAPASGKICIGLSQIRQPGGTVPPRK